VGRDAANIYTVKNTLQQLFAKTEVRTRSQLVRVALERYRELL
jgi:DNA-binding CsgD family transcriptional regulator